MTVRAAGHPPVFGGIGVCLLFLVVGVGRLLRPSSDCRLISPPVLSYLTILVKAMIGAVPAFLEALLLCEFGSRRLVACSRFADWAKWLWEFAVHLNVERMKSFAYTAPDRSAVRSAPPLRPVISHPRAV